MKEHSDTYNEIKQLDIPNAICRVHIPNLTDGERAAKMKALKKATEALLRSYERGA